jgi:hypothetical protein
MQITVGKSRVAGFIPFDQNNNPNPVGPDGQPLWPTDCVWSLGPPLGRDTGTDPVTGATLTPAADGNTCNVHGDTENASLILYVHGKREDGTIVHGGSSFDVVGEAGPVPVLSHLMIQWGQEV